MHIVVIHVLVLITKNTQAPSVGHKAQSYRNVPIYSIATGEPDTIDLYHLTKTELHFKEERNELSKYSAGLSRHLYHITLWIELSWASEGSVSAKNTRILILYMHFRKVSFSSQRARTVLESKTTWVGLINKAKFSQKRKNKLEEKSYHNV